MAGTIDLRYQWQGSHLLITVPIPEKPELIAHLENTLGVRITWINAGFGVPDPAVYEDADLLLTIVALPNTRSQCPKLKYVHMITAGIDYFRKYDVFGHPDIRWTYASGIHGVTMAEWVFMTYCAFEKDYAFYREEQKAKHFGFHFKAMRGRDLYGQTLGVVGYGSIGRQVARVGDAMGMKVLAFTATAKESAEKRREGEGRWRLPGTGDPEGVIPNKWFHGTSKEALHEFLRQGIDLLVLSMPLTESTRGAFGKEEFHVLKEHSPVGGAFIANLARGEVIRQDELIEALKTEGSGLRGAALDVMVPEPLPPDSPLWDAPNCWITPHNSSQNDRYVERGVDIFLENLSRPWDKATKFVNEVQIDRGY